MFVFICACLWLIFLPSCRTKPTNLRTLAPADSLIYLETNDLAAALQPIIDSKAFNEVAKTKPDFSALRGVQLAVVVTGFETKEEKLTEENSIGRVQPHFAAIADTHAWGWQTRSFAEDKLGEFINNIYGGGISLEVSDKYGGKYYVWTAEDGRKAYAFVQDSLIFFGNDESSIEKCLAVKRGEADSIAKNPKLPQPDANFLASGYVSPDGIAQIASIAALKFANEAGEDPEVKSAIAGILPQLLRSSITEINWTATKTEQGIEDKYSISMPTDVAGVLNETMAPAPEVDRNIPSQLPDDLPSVTQYNFKSLSRAWRSLAVIISDRTKVEVNTISSFLDSTLEVYGLRNGQVFLSGVGSTLITTQLSVENDKPLMIARINDFTRVGTALSKDLKQIQPKPSSDSPPFWKSDDGDTEVLVMSGYGRFGSNKGAEMFPTISGELRVPALVEKLSRSQAPIATIGRDYESASQIADLMSEKKSDDAKATSSYTTETRFTKTGIERRTVSDFGLIGSIIEQLADDRE